MNVKTALKTAPRSAREHILANVKKYPFEHLGNVGVTSLDAVLAATSFKDFAVMDEFICLTPQILINRGSEGLYTFAKELTDLNVYIEDKVDEIVNQACALSEASGPQLVKAYFDSFKKVDAIPNEALHERSKDEVQRSMVATSPDILRHHGIDVLNALVDYVPQFTCEAICDINKAKSIFNFADQGITALGWKDYKPLLDKLVGYAHSFRFEDAGLFVDSADTILKEGPATIKKHGFKTFEEVLSPIKIIRSRCNNTGYRDLANNLITNLTSFLDAHGAKGSILLKEAAENVNFYGGFDYLVENAQISLGKLGSNGYSRAVALVEDFGYEHGNTIYPSTEYISTILEHNTELIKTGDAATLKKKLALFSNPQTDDNVKLLAEKYFSRLVPINSDLEPFVNLLRHSSNQEEIVKKGVAFVENLADSTRILDACIAMADHYSQKTCGTIEFKTTMHDKLFSLADSIKELTALETPKGESFVLRMQKETDKFVKAEQYDGKEYAPFLAVLHVGEWTKLCKDKRNAPLLANDIYNACIGFSDHGGMDIVKELFDVSVRVIQKQGTDAFFNYFIPYLKKIDDIGGSREVWTNISSDIQIDRLLANNPRSYCSAAKKTY